MNIVTINGKTYTCENGSVSVINGKVYCNGELITDCNECKEKNIKITVEGDIGNLTTDVANVTVKGNCTKVITQTGDITVNGDVLGDASSSTGDISCNNISGNASTSTGDIIKGGKIRNIFKGLFD